MEHRSFPSICHPSLFIWRDVPIDVDVEMYKQLIKKWRAEVYIICVNGELEERKRVGIKGIAETIILAEKPNGEEYAKTLIDSNPDSIHIFAGMRGASWIFAKYCFKKGNKNILTLAERPNRKYFFFLDFLTYLVNVHNHIVYGKKVCARIQMASLGVKNSIEYGWDKEKVFPFMYCPNTLDCSSPKKHNSSIKFLYLGRFAKKYKGINILMKAVDMLDTKGWSLDFVGGYGPDKDELNQWAKKHNNVIVKGSWNQNDIVNNMRQYDVVIIPSTHDGWNLNANYAIQAGIGCIVSNRAGSSDLVTPNMTGLVYESDRAKDLVKCMEFAIANPSSVSKWKSNAEKIRPFITPEKVSDYLISIIEFTCLSSKKVPSCPWENLKRIFE